MAHLAVEPSAQSPCTGANSATRAVLDSVARVSRLTINALLSVFGVVGEWGRLRALAVRSWRAGVWRAGVGGRAGGWEHAIGTVVGIKRTWTRRRLRCEVGWRPCSPT
jgi:hypothetical protein